MAEMPWEKSLRERAERYRAQRAADVQRAAWLRTTRLQIGATQLHLAVVLDVGQSTVSFWEKAERSVPAEIVERWEEACRTAVKLHQVRRRRGS